MRLLFILLLICPVVHGQTLDVRAGQSTLYGGTGASVTAYLPQSTVNVGAGIVDGHFALGLSDSFAFHGYTATAGNSNFGFSVDGAGLVENVQGFAVQRSNEKSTLAGFVGATGAGYSLPFLAAGKAQHIGAGFYYKRAFNRLSISTLEAFSGGQRTAIQSAAYAGTTYRLSGTAGMLNNAPLLNGVAEWQPVRALHFAATKQELFSQVGSISAVDTLRATAENLSVYSALGHFSVQGSVLAGQSAGVKTSGASFGAGFHVGPVSEQSNWYESNHRVLLMHTVQESFRHWNFAQTMTETNGHNSYSAGGGYNRNGFSVSVSNSVLFFPIGGRGFEQVTSVTLSFRVPRSDATVTLSTSVDPAGKTLYSASGEDYLQANLVAGSEQSTRTDHSGKFLIAGTVQDEAGSPVSGAAVSVGGRIVYSNDAGQFFQRVKTDAAVTVKAVPEEFLSGRWVSVTGPQTAQPSSAVTITVRRAQ